MKVGIGLLWGGMRTDEMTSIVRKADELGYDWAGIWEHLVYPVSYKSPYPYSPTGSPPFADTDALDPFVVFGHLAAVTSRIRFRTNVYILPLRNPFVTARAVLTVDQLSGGRMDLGVGVGWLGEEFETVGEDFHNRGRRMDEIIQILKLLWTEDEPEFHGRYYHFAPVKFDPKPIHKPHPRILVGGESEAAIRRAARLGDGWLAAGSHFSAEDAAKTVRKLRGYLKDYGREQVPFEIYCGSFGWADLDTIRRYQDAGVDAIRVAPWLGDISRDTQRLGTGGALQQARSLPGLAERTMDSLERYAEQVLSKVDR